MDYSVSITWLDSGKKELVLMTTNNPVEETDDQYFYYLDSALELIDFNNGEFKIDSYEPAT